MDIHKAIIAATRWHADQKDLGGRPYILHPLSVLQRIKSPELKPIAVLHDVVEDCEVSWDELRAATDATDEEIALLERITKT